MQVSNAVLLWRGHTGMYTQTCNMPDLSYYFCHPCGWEWPQLNYPNSGDAFLRVKWWDRVSREEQNGRGRKKKVLWFSLEKKKELRRDGSGRVFRKLLHGDQEWPISCPPKHRKGSKRLKQQERLQLDFWRHILLGRTVKHWNRLCREMSNLHCLQLLSTD